MAWNAGPNHPPPPPPPGGTHPHSPAPPHFNSFWEMMQQWDPNCRAGHGVDHAAGPAPFDNGFTFGPNGFTFGPNGLEVWSGRRGFHGGWGRRGNHRRDGPRGSWGWGWGWDWPHDGSGDDCHEARRERRCGGRRGGFRRRGEAYFSGDEEMRDAAGSANDNEKATEAGAEHDPEKEGSPATMREGPGSEFPDPPEEEPEAFALPHRGRGGPYGRGGLGHRGRHGHHGHRGPHGFRGHHHGSPPPPPPPPPYSVPNGGVPPAFGALMNGVTSHPYARQFAEAFLGLPHARHRGERGMGGDNENNDNNDEVEDDIMGGENTFVPPVDIFASASAWTVHIALPGAKKEDVAINWDAHQGALAVSGVVYRPGDEAFLAGLVTGERKVGLFDRKLKLPPPGTEEHDEVEAEGIVARMEDGVLTVTVPKVEKEWTEVKKVDIE